MTPTSLCKANVNQVLKCHFIQDSWYSNIEAEPYMINKMNRKTISKIMCLVTLLVLFGTQENIRVFTECKNGIQNM